MNTSRYFLSFLLALVLTLVAAAAEPPTVRAVATGTGFFITTDGWFVTNAHVVKAGDGALVKIKDQLVPAEVRKVDESNDLALLKVPGSFTALSIARSQDAALGDAVFTIGFPNTSIQGVSPKLTRGEINSLAGIQDDPRFFQISVQIQPGNSGGALVNKSGVVVGIVCSRMNDLAALAASGSLPQNINYAVKSAYLSALIESEPGILQSLAQENRTDPSIEKIAEAATALVIVTSTEQPIEESPPASGAASDAKETDGDQESTISELHRQSMKKRREASQRREARKMYQFRSKDGSITFTGIPEKYKSNKNFEQVNVEYQPIAPGKFSYIPDAAPAAPVARAFTVILHSGLVQTADQVVDNDPYYDIIVADRTYSIRKALVKSVSGKGF